MIVVTIIRSDVSKEKWLLRNLTLHLHYLSCCEHSDSLLLYFFQFIQTHLSNKLKCISHISSFHKFPCHLPFIMMQLPLDERSWFIKWDENKMTIHVSLCLWGKKSKSFQLNVWVALKVYWCAENRTETKDVTSVPLKSTCRLWCHEREINKFEDFEK